MRTFALIFAFTASLSPLSATIFLLHGSFAAENSWYREGGVFHTPLKKEADKHGHEIIPFCWSGCYTSKGIIEASYNLIEKLAHHINDEEVIVIGHSNGGNVLAYATALLKAAVQLAHSPEKIEALVENLTQNFNDEETRSIQQPSPQMLVTAALQKLAPLMPTITKGPTKRKYFISSMFLLGTPINTKRFAIDMDMVKHVYNIHSENDYVQTLAGSAKLPSHKRVANLHLTFEHDSETFNPNHYELHSPLMGTWILSIPQAIKDQQTHKHRFVLKDGEIIISHKNGVLYQPH